MRFNCRKKPHLLSHTSFNSLYEILNFSPTEKSMGLNRQPFNSLYEIPLREHPEIAKTRLRLFQFSLWDSGVVSVSTQTKFAYWLSILFMRFSRFFSCHRLTHSWLSILFMRFDFKVTGWSKRLWFTLSILFMRFKHPSYDSGGWWLSSFNSLYEIP